MKRLNREGYIRCRVCGCTEIEPCEPPCSWVADDLCSACATAVDALVQWAHGAYIANKAALLRELTAAMGGPRGGREEEFIRSRASEIGAAPPYGYDWRMHTRPQALKRAGGRFGKKRQYIGGAACERCELADPIPKPKRSLVECAHLDGNCRNRDPDNIAILCYRCHRAHDYLEWARKCHETRAARKDAARPLIAASSGQRIEVIYGS